VGYTLLFGYNKSVSGTSSASFIFIFAYIKSFFMKAIRIRHFGEIQFPLTPGWNAAGVVEEGCAPGS